MKSLLKSLISGFFFSLILTSILVEPNFAADDLIDQGAWQEKGYSIKGEWQIVQRDNQKFIVFNEDFKTKKGPDLKVYLSKVGIQGLDGDRVNSSSVKISPLESHKGAQEYLIPESVNLDDFKSLVIHCEAYSHLWGGADLRQQ